MNLSVSKERIAKRMARSGLCSRREAERWISEGRVSVNGTVLTSPAINVTDDSEILVDGKPLMNSPSPRVWLYYKPSGLITTHHDPQGRTTIFEVLSESLPRVISVGRLDLNSEGLLLLTNDGEFARFAELPSTGWARSYRVRVYGKVDKEALMQLLHGVTIEGVRYKRIEAKVSDSHAEGSTNTWLLVTLYEGKNREIRKVMSFLGLQVNRLIRISYGPFQLGNLKPGDVKEVPPAEALPYFQ